MAPSDEQPTIVASATLRFPTAQASPASVDLSTLSTVTPTPAPAVTSIPTSGFRVTTPLTDADRSSSYFSLLLPSNFHWYPFKSICATLVKGRTQAKFTRASKESNLRYTVEAVTSVLGDNLNAADLTVEDFMYVLYWLRLASYTKLTFPHIAVCTAPGHVAKVKQGVLEPSTLKTVHTISQTNIQESVLNLDALRAVEAELAAANFPYAVSPVVMRDVVDYTELQPPMDFDPGDLAAAEAYRNANSEFEYLATRACALRVADESGVQLPLEQRMALVGDMSADQIALLDQYLVAASNYGIKESIVVKCKECGAEIQTELSVSAVSFL